MLHAQHLPPLLLRRLLPCLLPSGHASAAAEMALQPCLLPTWPQAPAALPQPLAMHGLTIRPHWHSVHTDTLPTLPLPTLPRPSLQLRLIFWAIWHAQTARSAWAKLYCAASLCMRLTQLRMLYRWAGTLVHCVGRLPASNSWLCPAPSLWSSAPPALSYIIM